MISARAIASFLLAAVLACPAATASPLGMSAPRPILPVAKRPRPEVQPPPGPSGAGQYSAVEFFIKTGADDLRVNSDAYAEMDFTDGSNQKCQFKREGDDAWGNDSSKTLQCHLDKARAYDELKGARIWIVKGEVVNFLWGSDNWNINDVKITAKDTASHNQTCVWEAKGDPLIRLTGTAPKFAVEDYDTDC
jgi:hypothetical protein